VAHELPDLIELLHRPLGEIVDICINWFVTETTGSCVGDPSRRTQGVWQHIVPTIDPGSADGYGPNQTIAADVRGDLLG
jgi:hypothetical protein